MSMYEKLGTGSNKVQQSPPGPHDFHSKQALGHLKPMTKGTGHNQSFESMPAASSLVHGSKVGRGEQSKMLGSGQPGVKGGHMSHTSSTSQPI